MMDLETLQQKAASCNFCSLYEGRNKAVFAKGNKSAKLMICGMVPADEENKAGIPFVGRAGKLLDKLLTDAHLSHDDVYITNLVKCYLAAGLPLKQEWIDACLPYLLVQINQINPCVILTLGKDASVALLGMDNKTSMSFLRSKVFEYTQNIKIIPTYHPSFLLRKGGERCSHYESVVMDFISAKTLTK